MSRVRYLLDEHVPQWLTDAVWHWDDAVEVRHVDGFDAPTKGTPDLELLRWSEPILVSIVTRDKSTMQDHANEHVARGGKTWGVFLLRDGFSAREVAFDLALIAATSDAEDWENQVAWLPL